MAEKMRVHILAAELSVKSKDVLAKCAAEGLSVKNHMTALGPGLEATIREWFTEGRHATTVETADRVDLKKVRKPRKKVAKARVGSEEPADGDTDSDVAVAVMQPEDAAATDAATPVLETATAAGAEEASDEEAGAQEAVAETPAPDIPDAADAAAAEAATEVPEATEGGDAPAAIEPPPGEAQDEADPEESQADGQASEDEEPPEAPEPIAPAGPQNVPAPAKLTGPRVVRYEAPDRDYVPPPRSPRRRPAAAAAAPGPGEVPAQVPEPGRGDARRRHEPGQGAAAADKKRGKAGATARTNTRGSAVRAEEKMKEWRDQDLIERQQRLAGATGRRIHRRRARDAGGGSSTAERKGKVQIQEPVMVKEFCAAVGIPFIRLVKVLQHEHNMMANINTTMPLDVVEMIAVEEGVELEILKAKSQLDVLQEEIAAREPTALAARPPVVTFLGHVDHGKTSMMDAIRTTRVASGEDGGITQHIGSYHLKTKNGTAVTFLDTPGHAAFTAMRARGAQMTDIAVLILAADDGIMPQTIEAINHAKAAEVPIVVAITKCDLGVFDEPKVFGQLAEHGLTPSGDWGGETDVIKTSAVTGEGIEELIEHLGELAELLDLKADFGGSAVGTVIEAETREGVGSAVRVLVQQGQLKPGMVTVCGGAFGKVRAILDDQGKRMKEAGPSIPCEIWGLDQVPSAGDRFYVLKSPQRAKSIAEETRGARIIEARAGTQKAKTLEDVFKQRDSGEIPELDLVIRADVDGSVDALRHVLGEIPSDQVTLSIRHTGVGAVSDSDVLLAQASNAIVVAFRVAPGAKTRKLAEECRVDIREYKVIYDVVDDIRKALEGLLAPEERLETKATLEVRNVFKISKVGAIAGCMVTDGLIARSCRVRLLRQGVIIRENCGIDSLKRFKDDAKEVRAGMECGLRLEGFDDIKEGDVIEAFEIIKTARTL